MAVDKVTEDVDVAQPARQAARSQEQFIAETLAWCAELFHSTRARFIRPTDNGGWIVYTLQHGSLTTHEADYAESAMARTVGLSRQPLLVSRPRVSRVGTTDLRPISVHSYLGIPLICQDRLAGVIECAGEARSDVEAALHSALPRLERAGARLLHDPALLPRPAIDAGTICVLSSALWTTGGVTLTPTDLALLSAIDGSTPVAAAAAAAGLEIESAIAMTRSLIEQGLVDVAP